MNRRQPPAFGVSFLLHAAALAIAVSLTPRLSLQLSSHAADSSVTKVSVQGQSRTPAADDLQKPSTKVTTELLFLLDKLAQGSYDALATLIGTSPARMEWTHTTSAEAYTLLLTIRRYYRSELDLKDLMGSSQLRGFYDRIRMAILTSVIATTPNGYRASDARFLVGRIYWRQGSVDEAARWWRDMTVDPADSYVTAYSQVLDAVRRAGPNGERLDRGAINSALNDERRNWVDFWETRLKQFGYSFDVY